MMTRRTMVGALAVIAAALIAVTADPRSGDIYVAEVPTNAADGEVMRLCRDLDAAGIRFVLVIRTDEVSTPRWVAGNVYAAEFAARQRRLA